MSLAEADEVAEMLDAAADSGVQGLPDHLSTVSGAFLRRVATLVRSMGTRLVNAERMASEANAAAARRNATIRTLTDERDRARKELRAARQQAAGFEGCLVGMAKANRYATYEKGGDVVAVMFRETREHLVRIAEIARRDLERVGELEAEVRGERLPAEPESTEPKKPSTSGPWCGS